MVNEPSITMTRCVRPWVEAARASPGNSRCQTGSNHGMTAAMASTTRRTSRVRTANRSHCSSFSRRRFFFWAASRKRMAAQFTTTYRLRLSRWMMTGTAAAPPATAAAARGDVNRTPINGSISMGSAGSGPVMVGAGRAEDRGCYPGPARRPGGARSS
jgi:hypothetical protein